MNEVKVNTQKNLTVPAGADGVSITHEWGDQTYSASSLTPGNTVAWTPDSIGVHEVSWLNGSTVVSASHYEVIMHLVTSSEFFVDYPELETEDEAFPANERKARKIIEIFTGQKFGPYIDKSFRIQGDGGDNLEIPVKILSLTSVTDQWAEDLTDLLEIAAGEPYFLQYKDRFRRPFYQDYKRDLSTERRKQDFFTDKLDFTILGDFGWKYIPTGVTEACKLLIADEFTGSNDLRQSGINEAQLGDFSYKLNADQWGTTGNTQADLLLAEFCYMRVGVV